MALNPFFLQGSPGEQRLVQDLINEQLKIYGVEVIYIPRKFVRKQTILKEISSSKFDDNFAIEAYVNSYDGYTGQGDLLTKFGVSLKDELNLVISRERFEDFISPFLDATSSEIELASRPREGDLVYFPLGQRLFEVKFVEHESSFYQLGKLYVYELKCELFEYEDEVLDTSIDEIDTQIQEEGYITTLNLIGTGTTATATAAGISSGYIREIFLNNDGYGYTSTPTVGITSAPAGGINATAVAITTYKAGVYSIDSILLTCAGAGYTSTPTISITGGGGTGAAVTCSISTNSTYKGILQVLVTNPGSGYAVAPTVTISNPNIGGGTTATAIALVSAAGTITSFRLTNPGFGYTQSPTITISSPANSGVGTYKFNEIVTGSSSGTQGRVKSWDVDTKVLKVSLVENVSSVGFYPGENIVGSSSSAVYAVSNFNTWNIYDKYSENKEIEDTADTFLDFSQSNPFGNY